MSIFEAGMLLSFGLAWPFSIYKSYTSRANNGKSFLFLIAAVTGYACGIINKLLYSFDIVLVLYVLNFLMVSIDGVLWLRNHKIEKLAAKEANV